MAVEEDWGKEEEEKMSYINGIIDGVFGCSCNKLRQDDNEKREVLAVLCF